MRSPRDWLLAGVPPPISLFIASVIGLLRDHGIRISDLYRDVTSKSKQGGRLMNKIKKYLLVLKAECTCAVGAAPAYCKHVFSVLHSISDYSKQKMHSAPTAKLQTWHQPKALKTVPLPCKEVFWKPVTYDGLSNTEFNWKALTDFSLPIFDACIELVEAKYQLAITLPAAICSSNNNNE
ncbi:hypothetical protein HNY73_011314 [Argiope bruennichi]|uniref:SWIM-type domain-containing protein n=1 Tax=Argiope bruennichi TaxID=94029 RepID=A0A8T0F8T2_ARGBR|nr:hypothetical protein HNY73_011314 [Argiope bruennichi]